MPNHEPRTAGKSQVTIISDAVSPHARERYEETG